VKVVLEWVFGGWLRDTPLCRKTVCLVYKNKMQH